MTALGDRCRRVAGRFFLSHTLSVCVCVFLPYSYIHSGAWEGGSERAHVRPLWNCKFRCLCVLGTQPALCKFSKCSQPQQLKTFPNFVLGAVEHKSARAGGRHGNSIHLSHSLGYPWMRPPTPPTYKQPPGAGTSPGRGHAHAPRAQARRRHCPAG